jgi:hypothetical protein
MRGNAANSVARITVLCDGQPLKRHETVCQDVISFPYMSREYGVASSHASPARAASRPASCRTKRAMPCHTSFTTRYPVQLSEILGARGRQICAPVPLSLLKRPLCCTLQQVIGFEGRKFTAQFKSRSRNLHVGGGRARQLCPRTRCGLGSHREDEASCRTIAAPVAQSH